MRRTSQQLTQKLRREKFVLAAAYAKLQWFHRSQHRLFEISDRSNTPHGKDTQATGPGMTPKPPALEANATARPRGPLGPSPDQLWAARTPITQAERLRFYDQSRQRLHADSKPPKDGPRKPPTPRPANDGPRSHQPCSRRAWLSLPNEEANSPTDSSRKVANIMYGAHGKERLNSRRHAIITMAFNSSPEGSQ